MSNLPLVVELNIAGNTLPVRQLRGREAMSCVFRLEVELILPDDIEIDADAVVKSEASITFVRDSVQRRIDGVVAEVLVMKSITGRPELLVALEPRLSLCQHRTNIKIFRNKTAPQIVAEVLAETGVAFEQRLSDTYPVRPYTLQHRETDLHFVSRMLEEEGMFYFFAEGDVMVIGDNPSAYDEAGPFPFRIPATMDEHEESVWEMGELAEAGVSKVSLRDWTIDRPSLPMDVSATGPTAAGPEWYDYPGEYEDPGAGQRLANLIAESYACAGNQFAGRASAAAFAPGKTFAVEGSPGGAIDGSFVLTAVEHDYHRVREGWSVVFEGLDAATTYRPLRVHHEPVLYGPVTGIVTGPEGADIHCDELGRVKVHFHWDRLLPYDDDCSHWVPVIQDNTGHSVSIPRIGWEVVVHFLEGDPDRPVVLGRVYNAEDTYPIKLPEYKTWTMLHSHSSPGRGGFNEIQFEDRAGEQRIVMHAEKDQNVVIGNDKTEHVISSEGRGVGRDEKITIGSNQEIKVGAMLTTTVKGNQTIAVGANETRKVGDGMGITIGGDHQLSIGGMHFRRIAKSDTVNTPKLSETVGGVILEASFKANSFAASKGMAVVVGGAMIEVAKVNRTESASKARVETIGGVYFIKSGEELKVNAGKKRTTTVGAMFKVKTKKQLSLTGTDKLTMKSVEQILEAPTSLTFEVGGSTLTMKEGVIEIITPKIMMTVSGTNNLGATESYQN